MPAGVFATQGGHLSFIEKARQMVFDRVNYRLLHGETNYPFSLDDVTAYWFSDSEANWEVRLSTKLPDSIYYRVFHDKVAKKTTFDVYHKFDTQSFDDDGVY